MGGREDGRGLRRWPDEISSPAPMATPQPLRPICKRAALSEVRGWGAPAQLVELKGAATEGVMYRRFLPAGGISEPHCARRVFLPRWVRFQRFAAQEAAGLSRIPEVSTFRPAFWAVRERLTPTQSTIRYGECLGEARSGVTQPPNALEGELHATQWIPCLTFFRWGSWHP